MLFRRGGSGFGGGVLGGYLAPARTHKAPHTNTNARNRGRALERFLSSPHRTSSPLPRAPLFPTLSQTSKRKIKIQLHSLTPPDHPNGNEPTGERNILETFFTREWHSSPFWENLNDSRIFYDKRFYTVNLSYIFQRNELGCIRHGRRGTLSGRVISLSDFLLWRKLMVFKCSIKRKKWLTKFST